jgi:hypothetical protein
VNLISLTSVEKKESSMILVVGIHADIVNAQSPRGLKVIRDRCGKQYIC